METESFVERGRVLVNGVDDYGAYGDLLCGVADAPERIVGQRGTESVALVAGVDGRGSPVSSPR